MSQELNFFTYLSKKILLQIGREKVREMENGTFLIIVPQQKVRGAPKFALASTLAKVPSGGIFPDSAAKASSDDRDATSRGDNACERKKK